MTNNCNICLEVSGLETDKFDPTYSELIRTRKNIILESTNFLVIPSFGPLNHSHAMLIPKKHANSFAELSTAEIDEGFGVLDLLRSYIQEKTDKTLVFFESGAGTMTSHSGGCITHAHIHCVIYSEKFDNRIMTEIALEPLLQRKDYSTSDTKAGYVWYLNKNNISHICNNPMLPSQFLRYIYAQACDSSSAWNWRRNINITGVLSVLQTYKDLVSPSTYKVL
ncbi:conserved hypothetical protein [Pseudomonas sp. 9AZ]|nr:conserved hypothetical protein [Pseudomonas sp. 9AZ]